MTTYSLGYNPFLMQQYASKGDQVATSPLFGGGAFGSWAPGTGTTPSGDFYNQQGWSYGGSGGEDAIKLNADLFNNARNWLNTNPNIWDPYSGQMTAGIDPLQQQAQAGLLGFLGGNPYTQNAASALSGYLGYQPQMFAAPTASAYTAGYAGNVNPSNVNVNPGAYAGDVRATGVMYPGNVNAQQVQAGSFLNGDINAYQNPYTNQVVNASLNDLERSRQIANQQGARSAGAGTYGGDRNALVEAATNEAYARQAGNLSAQLRSQGFDTAAGLMGQDLSRQFNAGLANQGAGLQAALANQQAMMGQGQFNAGLGLQAALANQAARQQYGQFGANLGLQAALANQSTGLQAGLANQATQQQAGQFDATQLSNMSNLNAQLAMQAALANQQAGLQGANVGLNAAGLLGTLGQNYFNQGLAGLTTLNQFGSQNQQTQQNALDAAYNEYLRSTYGPMQGFNFLGGLAGGVPYDPSRGGSLASGLLGLGLTGLSFL